MKKTEIETLEKLANSIQEMTLMMSRDSIYSLSKSNEAKDAAKKAYWKGRHDLLEQLFDVFAATSSYIVRRHPELKREIPEELLPPEMKKRPYLAVDNEEKK